MREVLAAIAMFVMLGGVTHLSIEAVVADEERSEAVSAALRAEAAANEAEWVALQVVDRQDTICECTYNLIEDPTAKHLRHAAAIHCKRCRILSVNGPTSE